MDTATVKKMAALARIHIEEPELASYQNALGKMVALAEKMLAVDTKGVEPMFRPHEGVQFLREDQVTETDQRDLYLALAPVSIAGLYLVPQVIE